MKQSGLKVFVAGPYTAGDVAVNVSNAIEAGLALLDAGHFPFIPHLCHFIHMHSPRSYDTWVAFDNAFLLTCNALVRLPGVSPGADAEVRLANDINIPVFQNVDEFLNS